MKFDEILEVFKKNSMEMTPEQFASYDDEGWEKAVTDLKNHLVNQPDLDISENFLSELEELKTNQRKNIFENHLRDTYPPSDKNYRGMNFDQLANYMNLPRVKMLTMSEENWKTQCGDFIDGLKQKESSDKKMIAEYEKFLMGLVSVESRQQFFVDSYRYQHLQTLSANTPAHNALIPTSILSVPGYNSSSLYKPVGNSPQEMAKNKQLILDAYKEEMRKYYNLPQNAAERQKYPTEEAFLNAFKPQENNFKDFASLEKSDVFKNLSKEDQDLYRNQKSNFPLHITTLPFQDAKAGQNFMEDMVKRGLIKKLEPVEEKKLAETSSPSTPTLGGGHT